MKKILMRKRFEKAKKQLEQEKKQTYAVRNINKEAIKKACEKEKLKPKELINKIFIRWLLDEGYLKKEDLK